MVRSARVLSMVTTASLAGVASRSLWDTLPPCDRKAADSVYRCLREGRSREEGARRFTVLRAALERPGERATDGRHGAKLYARWMQSLRGTERAAIARALDARSIELVCSTLPDCTPLDDAMVAITECVVAFGAKVFGRLPTAHELAMLLALASGTLDVREDTIVRWERSLRVAGRQEALVALAGALGCEG